MNELALSASLHGVFGVLAVAALVHPAILLRRGRPLSRGLRWSIGLTAAVTSIAFAWGVAIYEPYREVVKRPLFVADRAAGLLFETKEHLAFAVLALTLGASVCAFVAPRARADLRRLAAALFAGAAVLALVVASLGLYVSSVASFASVGVSSAASSSGGGVSSSGLASTSPPAPQSSQTGQVGHAGHGVASGHAGSLAATGPGSAAHPSSAR